MKTLKNSLILLYSLFTTKNFFSKKANKNQKFMETKLKMVRKVHFLMILRSFYLFTKNIKSKVRKKLDLIIVGLLIWKLFSCYFICSKVFVALMGGKFPFDGGN